MPRTAATRQGRAAYREFQVLLDDPANSPSGGFDAYAQALADIILHSPPRFAVGIFGSWGSGKTTLMQAIARELKPQPHVVQVEFNAWRYEREEHLIVPLLDTLREALVDWSRDHANEPEGPAARRAASAVGRAARALLRGLTLSAKVPFVAEGFDEQAADEPSSFYHTSFRSLERAIADFVAKERRIVVFIDDLDRCLPASALEVLESMKLFFDLPGFVFVVGLDQAVIERSIEFKYGQGSQRVFVWPPATTTANGGGSTGPESSLEANSPINGGEYIKKIFQVPFSLPPIARADLRRFFEHIVTRADLPPGQLDDLRKTVVQHLPYLSPDDTVNPRDVKRFVNAYTIQLKMLAPKLRSGLKPHVVLALLVTSFRADWERVYGLLVADPGAFVEAVGGAGPDGAWIDDEPVPPSLLAYLAGPGSPLLGTKLEPYVTSVETTQTSDRSLQAAQSHLSNVRRLVTEIRAQAPDARRQSKLHEELERLRSKLSVKTKASPLVSNALAQIETLQLQVKELPELADDRSAWVDSARRRLDQIREILVALRRQASVGGRTQQ
jgi:RecA/RadA recombinase